MYTQLCAGIQLPIDFEPSADFPQRAASLMCNTSLRQVDELPIDTLRGVLAIQGRDETHELAKTEEKHILNTTAHIDISLVIKTSSAPPVVS